MIKFSKGAAFGTLLLLGAAGCADLDVANTNEPTRAGALRTSGDIESLISGTFATWFHDQHANFGGCERGPSVFLGIQAMQQSNSWNNCRANPMSQIPRPSLPNEPANASYPHISQPWYNNYRVIASVSQGLQALAADTALVTQLGASGHSRVQAFGNFMLGLAHATLATLYDRSFIIDETVALTDAAGQPIEQELHPYGEVMAAALGYFDKAIAASTAAGASFSIPTAWTGGAAAVSNAQLARIAHGMKARYRVAVARTMAESNAVNWAAVLTDLTSAAGQEWVQFHDGTKWFSNAVFWQTGPGYAWISYQYMGMADQSGRYQQWLALPVSQRHPNLSSTNPFIIVTPDKRFPQGATIADQRMEANRGLYYAIPTTALDGFTEQAMWNQAARGTWRWSYYYRTNFNTLNNEGDNYKLLAREELRLLAAEALFRTGNLAAAADSINVTRVGRGGLNPTNAAGLNTSCVPKLPNGACGNLFDMLKWEKKVETIGYGNYAAGVYFDMRRWQELYKNTQLQFPIPAKEIQLLQLGPVYTFGGGLDSSAPTSVYAFPNEG